MSPIAQFPNYRNTSASLVSDPETCGYSAMNVSHPYNQLLNKSKALQEPDDSGMGFNSSLLNLSDTSNPHPGHGPMLAQQSVAAPGATYSSAPVVVGVVAAAAALVAFQRRRRQQYVQLDLLP